MLLLQFSLVKVSKHDFPVTYLDPHHILLIFSKTGACLDPDGFFSIGVEPNYYKKNEFLHKSQEFTRPV